MRLLLTGMMVLFLYISCGEKIPTDVIRQNQMSDILLDVHLADGELSSMAIDSARAYRETYYDAIFNRYGIDSTMFRRSIEFYSSRPYIMKEFYISIEKKLEGMNKAEQEEIEAKYRSQRLADSIRNVQTLDSLYRIKRDSLDLKRKRYLLFMHKGDSTYNGPDSVSFEQLRNKMLEDIGFDRARKLQDSIRQE
ncbi:DUF4296 domain-containing protein [Parapedobacter tibetensis]|uniref:DUF4296 domain-containing protein n=1 Tax=Parapedobacter tibetensis TaxID=2972951 RepID=UPI00214D3904|nr:DUF4296 domain-containing protein [Parapedobacter tibetensis]